MKCSESSFTTPSLSRTISSTTMLVSAHYQLIVFKYGYIEKETDHSNRSPNINVVDRSTLNRVFDETTLDSGYIRHAEKETAQTRQQCETIVPHLFLLCHDHHLVEKLIDRCS